VRTTRTFNNIHGNYIHDDHIQEIHVRALYNKPPGVSIYGQENVKRITGEKEISKSGDQRMPQSPYDTVTPLLLYLGHRWQVVRPQLIGLCEGNPGLVKPFEFVERIPEIVMGLDR
jgi:hypothetical protein